MHLAYVLYMIVKQTLSVVLKAINVHLSACELWVVHGSIGKALHFFPNVAYSLWFECVAVEVHQEF